MDAHAFDPIGNTVALAVTATSSSVALSNIGIDATSADYRLYNAGPSTVFVAFGGSAVVSAPPVGGAPANGIPIPSGVIEVLRSAPNEVYIAAVTTTGTATLYVTSGQGL